ncbi:MAG: TonB-dependent receptor [Proteobacteria bacterium]|nr:TonB-dependent receptor [Pseudomonadota bacterium]
MFGQLNATKTQALTGASLGVLALMMVPAQAQDNSAPVSLGPVTVQSDTDKNALNHAPPVSNMPSESIQDTPQAVTVVTGETMKQQATTTLGDALRNVPGITIAIGEGGTLAGDQFKIRGFDAKDDVYLDGLRDFAAYTRDSFNYEEVQVLKGPSGLMFGRGTTGGAINTVSKTPFLADSYVAHVEGGNGDHFRGTADLNYQLSDTAAVRLNLMLTDTGVVDRDLTHSHRWGIAPSIALGLGTDTVFTASYIHQHTNNRPDYGLPVAVQPNSVIALPVSEYGVPRSNYLGYNTDTDRNDADIVTAKLTHVAADWLTVENDIRGAAYSRYFQYTTIDRCDTTAATNNCAGSLFGANPTATLGGIGGGGPYQQNSWGVQDVFTANANFRVGGMRNQFITGLDVSYQNADRTVYAYNLPTVAQFIYTLNDHGRSRANIGRSLYNPDPNPPPFYTVVLPTPANVANTNAAATTVVNSSGRSTDLAFFATDRLWFTDEFSLIAGVRVDRYNATYSATTVGSATVAPVTTIAKSPSTIVNPRASLVWEPDKHTTVYFSYGKSAVPQGTSVVGSPTPITTANQALDPEKSETFELGAKYGLFDGALGLAGSVFKVDKANAALVDPVSGNLTLQSGQKQRVQGVELSVTGKVTENFNITTAYTYLDPVVTNDLSCGGTPSVCKPNPYTIGSQITFVPKNAASLWADYSAKDFIPGLVLGGGLVYQSRLFNAVTTTGTAPNLTGISRIAVIPETIELDAVASYDFGGAYRIQFNINNITDRLNYSQSFGNRGTPSPGRTFIISLEASL